MRPSENDRVLATYAARGDRIVSGERREVSSSPIGMNVIRTELRPVSAGRFTDWMRRTFARPAPRARVIAPAAVHLGAPLEVEWFLWHDAPEITLVTVSLVGSEIARRRISARTGISIVTETRPFLVLEIDRQVPDRGSPVASGHVEALVPSRTVPSLVGKLNEIAWAVIVEASFHTVTILRQQFPLAVLPVER
jgi:hypothetical protein